MPVPDLPFLPGDIDWVAVPIRLWVVAAIVALLVAALRFGRRGARDKLVKYRGFWAVSLVIALVLTAVMWAGEQG